MRIYSPIHSAADVVRDAPLEQLGPVLSALMKRVTDHRDAHNGFIPLSVFPLMLGIAGRYTALEAVPRMVEGEQTVGYLLRQRGAGEHGWQSQYHIPGVIVVPRKTSDSMAAAQQRLEKEIDFFPQIHRKTNAAI